MNTALLLCQAFQCSYQMMLLRSGIHDVLQQAVIHLGTIYQFHCFLLQYSHYKLTLDCISVILLLWILYPIHYGRSNVLWEK